MGNKSSKKHYSVPPNAGRPSPSGTPQADVQDAGIFLHWMPPKSDGGCPMIGYIVQHSELQEGIWHSSSPIRSADCIVENLVPGATYQFRVIGENLIGYSAPSPASDPVVYTKELVAPTFLTPLSNVTAIENEKVEFKVRVTGRPQPITRWFLNDEALDTSEDESILVEPQRCVFQRVLSRFEGEVRCVAYNEMGSDESTCQLTVGAPPRIQEESTRELMFQVDELLRVKFTFSGRPEPKLTWFHNGVPIRDHIETLGSSTSLKIPHATRQDRGEYSIRLENHLGSDSASALVTVADKPGPPSAPTVLLLKDNSCLLEWKHAEDDGGCPVQCSIIEYFRVGWDVWLTGGTSRGTAGKIRDLIPGSKYKFRVKSENLYGLSEPSGTSVEIFIPEMSSGLMSPVEESEEENEKPAQSVEERKPSPTPPVTQSKPPTQPLPLNSTRISDTKPLQPLQPPRLPHSEARMSSSSPSQPARPEESKSLHISPNRLEKPRPSSPPPPAPPTPVPVKPGPVSKPEILLDSAADSAPRSTYLTRAELRKALPRPTTPVGQSDRRSSLLFDHYTTPRSALRPRSTYSSSRENTPEQPVSKSSSLPRHVEQSAGSSSPSLSPALRPLHKPEIVVQPDVVQCNSLGRGLRPPDRDPFNRAEVSTPSSTSRSSSVASSNLIFEGASSSDDDEDTSIVTSSSLTVLKSGTCAIRTRSSKEALNEDSRRGSRESLSSRSRNSLTSSADIAHYYSSIFGQTTYGDESADDQYSEEPVAAHEEPVLETGGAETEPGGAETEPGGAVEGWGGLWGWHLVLVPLFVVLFIKFTLWTNVGVMVWVLYRLLMLCFD